MCIKFCPLFYLHWFAVVNCNNLVTGFCVCVRLRGLEFAQCSYIGEVCSDCFGLDFACSVHT